MPNLDLDQVLRARAETSALRVQKMEEVLQARQQKIQALGGQDLKVLNPINPYTDAWTTQLGLNPNGFTGRAVNLGASLYSGAGRVLGDIASLPLDADAAAADMQLQQRHLDAWARVRNGQGTPEDQALLNTRATPDSLSPMEQIARAAQDRKDASGIDRSTDLSSAVHQGQRQALMQQLGEGFESPWNQVKQGWEALGSGAPGSGAADVVSGLAKLVYRAGEAALTHPQAAAELVAENAPQLALGAFGKAGQAALGASNLGYGIENYRKGIEKYQAEHNGAYPPEDVRQQMALWSAAAVVAEQAGDTAALKLGGVLGKAGEQSVQDLRTGLKASLLNTAKAGAEGYASEAATEGFQTYAEGQAQLQPATAKEVYQGAVVGGLAGGGLSGGLRAGAELLGATPEQQAVRAAQAQQQAARTVNLQQAIETGDVSAFTRPGTPEYDPVQAAFALHMHAKQDGTTFEQRQQTYDQAVSLIAQLGNAVDDAKTPEDKQRLIALQGNLFNKLYAFKADKERADNAQSLSPQDVDNLVATATGTAPASPAVPGSETAAAAPAEPSREERHAAAQRAVILSMQEPDRVSPEQAQALADHPDNGLTETQRSYLRTFSQARIAENALKDLHKVSREVYEGGNGNIGIRQYQGRFRLGFDAGNAPVMDQQIQGLQSFLASHAQKSEAVRQAFEQVKNLPNRLGMFVLRRTDGSWETSEVPAGWSESKANAFAQKNGGLRVHRGSAKLVANIPTEAQAISLAISETQQARDLKLGVETSAAPTTPAPASAAAAPAAPTPGAAPVQDAGQGHSWGTAEHAAQAQTLADQNSDTQGMKLRPAAAAEASTLTAALQEAGKLFGEQAAKSVFLVHENHGWKGSVIFDAATGQRFITIGTQAFEQAVKARSLGPVLHVLAHELAHAYDEDTGWTSAQAESLKPSGYAYQEAQTSMAQDTTLKSWFGWIFDPDNLKPEARPLELFAQLHSLYVTRPDLMQAHLKDTYAKFESAYTLHGDQAQADQEERQGVDEAQPAAQQGGSTGTGSESAGAAAAAKPRLQGSGVTGKDLIQQIDAKNASTVAQSKAQETGDLDALTAAVEAHNQPSISLIQEGQQEAEPAQQPEDTAQRSEPVADGAVQPAGEVQQEELKDEGVLEVFRQKLAQGTRTLQELWHAEGFNPLAQFLKQKASNPLFKTRRPLVAVKDFFHHWDSNFKRLVALQLLESAPTVEQAHALGNLHQAVSDWIPKLQTNLMAYTGHADYKTRDMLQFLLHEDAQGLFVESNVAGAMAAGMYSWILARANSEARMSREDINKLHGRDKDGDIYGDGAAVLGNKHGIESMTVAELGDLAVQFLGFEAGKDAPKDLLPKLKNALGTHMLLLLEKEGFVARHQLPFKQVEAYFPKEAASDDEDIEQGEEGFSGGLSGFAKEPMMEYVEFLWEEAKPGRFVLPTATKAIRDANVGTAGVVDKLLGADRAPRIAESTPRDFTQTHAKNTDQRIPDKLREVLQATQQIPHHAIREMLELGRLLGREAVLKAAGWQDLNENRIAARNMDAVAAQNHNLELQLDLMLEMLGLDPDFNGDLEKALSGRFYVTAQVWKNFRAGFTTQSLNQQTSKIHRTMMAREGWEVDLDLNDANQEREFLLSAYMNLGFKTDAQPNDVSMGMLDAWLQKQPLLVQALELVHRGVVEGHQAWTPAERDIVGEAAGAAEGMLSLQAMVALAKYHAAKEAKAPSVKVTMLVGADGKTNGPMLTSFALGAAEGIEDMYALLNRGGFYSTDANQAQHFSQWKSQPDAQGRKALDLYEHLASLVLQKIQARVRPLADIKALWQQRKDIHKRQIPALEHQLAQLQKLKAPTPAHIARMEVLSQQLQQLKDWASDLAAQAKPLVTPEQYAAVQVITKQLQKDNGEVASAGRNLVKTPLTAFAFGSALGKSVASMGAAFIDGLFTAIEDLANGTRDGMGVRDVLAAANTLMDLGARGRDGVQHLRTDLDVDQALKLQLTVQQQIDIFQGFRHVVGGATRSAMEEAFATFIERRRTMNKTIGAGFVAYKAAYDALRAQMIQQWMDDGSIAYRETTKKGAKVREALHDLTAAQEKVLHDKLSDVLPAMHTAYSKEEKDVGKGLLMAKQKPQVSDSELYSNKVNVAEPVVKTTASIDVKTGQPKTEEKGFLTTKSKVRGEVAPGVAGVPYSIHSLDSYGMHSAIQDILARIDQANPLNVHDEASTAFKHIAQVAQALNQNIGQALLDYSPAREALRMFEHQVVGLAARVKEGSLPAALPATLREAWAAAYNIGLDEADRITAQQAPDVLMQQAVSNAFEADKLRLEALAKLSVVDQYVWEGGQWQPDDAFRAEAQKQLGKLLKDGPAASQELHDAIGFLQQTGEGMAPQDVDYTSWLDAKVDKPDRPVPAALGHSGPIPGAAATATASNPTPEQVSLYTTAQVFEALGQVQGPNPGGRVLAFEHLARLRGLLDTMVAQLFGPGGSFATNHVPSVAATPLEVWAKAQATGQAPFVSTITGSLALHPQEAFVIEQVEATMRAALRDNEARVAVPYQELAKLYQEAHAQLKPSDFNDPALYDLLFKVESGIDGRSNYLSRFAALGLGHQDVHRALGIATARQKASLSGLSFEDRLRSIFSAVLAWFHGKLTHTTPGEPMNQALNKLVGQLVDIEARKRTRLSRSTPTSAMLSKAEDAVGDIAQGAKKLVDTVASSALVRGSRSGIVQGLGALASVAANDRVSALTDKLMQWRDEATQKRHGWIAGLVNELRGQPQDIAVLLRAAKEIEKERQHHITDTMKAVLTGFENQGKDLGDDDKRALTQTFLRTGAHVLEAALGLEGLQSLLQDPAAIEAAIRERIGGLSEYAAYQHFFVHQAKALGYFRATGRVKSRHLLMNAGNIARMYGTRHAGALDQFPDSLARVQSIVEQLTALYALQYLKPETREQAAAVLEAEAARPSQENGVQVLLGLHRFLEGQSRDRLFSGSEALAMHGYTPEIYNHHTDLAVGRTEEERQALAEMGYEAVDTLDKDPDDPDAEPATLYVLKDGGMLPRVTGAMSLTGEHAKGSKLYGGRNNVFDPDAMRNMMDTVQINRARTRHVDAMFQPNPGFDPRRVEATYMAPVLNQRGGTAGWRYLMQEDTKDALLERDNRPEMVLGTLAGSIYDKAETPQHNRQVIEALKAMYDADTQARPGRYARIANDSEDPDLLELYRLLPDDTQTAIRSIWGRGGMMVPWELLDSVFGYRKISLSQAFDKQREGEELNAGEKVLVQGMEAVLYNGARTFKGMSQPEARTYAKRGAVYVRRAEKVWQEIVKEVKDIIVVKSGVVLLGNIKSNLSYLVIAGVPLKTMAKHHRVAIKGGLQYQRDRAALAQIEIKLDSGTAGNEARALERQAAILRDSMMRNPVRDLIEGGLMPTIVEDVDIEDDLYSYRTQFTRKVDGLAQKVNPVVLKAAKYAYMTHDTPLYQFMSQATQLSDFVARYVLYQHLTTRSENRLSKEDALHQASETFINYDVPMHRGLQYMDDHGLMMFSKYALRIQRVLAKLLKEHPARVLSSVLLGHYVDNLDLVTEGSWIHRIGRNPLEPGAFKYPFVLDELATVRPAMALVQ